MGSTWSRSLAIARQSVAVLRANPALMAFPVVSGTVSLLLSAAFLLPIYFLMVRFHGDHVTLQRGGYVPLAIYYLVSYFVVIFFNVGLSSCVNATLRGEHPTFSDGVRFAQSRLGPIFGWSILAATVGMILKIVGDNSRAVGQIVAAILGAAWNVVTFLVVPVLAMEGKGPFAALKSSTMLLKRTWGEQIVGNAGIGLIFLPAVLVPFAFLVLAFVSGSTPVIVAAVAFAVLFWVALAVLSTSLSEVYRTALYVYATTGQPPMGFDGALIQSAFRPKKIRFGG